MERKDAVKMKGNPMTLVGPELKTGDEAPEFELLDNELNPVHLSDSVGRVRFFSVVPSLDTPVCSTQTDKFNKEMGSFGDRVQSYTVSADLPFAQARFCGEHKIDNMKTLSDHKEMSFGQAYGLMIKELRLLARAVVIVDADDTIAYFQLVPEATDEPDYDDALQALKKLVG